VQIQQKYPGLTGEDRPLARDKLTRLIRDKSDLSVIAEARKGRKVQLRRVPPARGRVNVKVFGMVSVSAVMLGAGLALSGCESHRGDRLPAIEFTKIPPAAQGDREKMQNIAGSVTGARPRQQIVVYAHSGAWWVQPTLATPFIPIRPDSTWSTETPLGYEYAGLLTDPGCRPPATEDTPPSKGGPVTVTAIVKGIRPTILAATKPVKFSGHDWDVRTIASDRGGSSYPNSTDNAWTDSAGALHLRISKTSDDSSRAEVVLNRSLGYGSYVLVVRDISHLEPTAVLSIATIGCNVRPTLVQSSWFRTVLLLFAGLVTLATYRLRVHHLRGLLNLRYEERLAERTRIAQELHDTLLQSFQGLMLRLQAANQILLFNPLEAKEALEGTLDRADQALIESRKAIQGIRSDSFSDRDIERALGGLMNELATDSHLTKGKRPTTSVIVEGQPQTVNPWVCEEICKIAREALRNAFIHGDAQHIESEVAFSKKFLRVRFRDDGVGIDPTVLEGGVRAGHWGLIGMHERAKRLRGHVNVWSKPDAGTEVELTIPASTAFESGPWWISFNKIGAGARSNL
jgi:signal transduction histidine kinase